MVRMLFFGVTHQNFISIGIKFLTVHELKQLVDDGLQELPVRSEEARVLAHNVHDV